MQILHNINPISAKKDFITCVDMVVNRDRTMGKEKMGKGKGEKADKVKENILLVNCATQLSFPPSSIPINQ